MAPFLTLHDRGVTAIFEHTDGDPALAVLGIKAARQGDAQSVGSYSGRHNAEFGAVDDVLRRSQLRRGDRRGLISHDCFPGAVVKTQDAAYGAQLDWSGRQQ
jgi:hypothetical protein